MPVVELAWFVPAATAAIRASIVAAVDGRLGSPPRVWSADEVPDQPVEPYAVLQRVDVGFGWDPGLDAGGTSAFTGLQVTGVGRLEESASWVCDLVRVHLLGGVPATVTGSVGTHLKSVTSQGPPFGPLEAGTLLNMTETYLCYLEAS